MADTPAATTPEKTDDMQLLRKGRHVLNGLFGAAALGIGAAFVATSEGFLLPLALGVMGVAVGADALYETARATLPQKTQNAISQFFTGHDVLPRKAPTLVQQGLRVLGYGTMASLGFMGGLVGAIGLAFGGGIGSAAMFWGGGFLAAGSIPKALSYAAKYVRLGMKQTEGPVVQDAVPAADDAAPAPKLQNKGAEAGFNVAANPAPAAPEAAPAAAPAAPAPVI